MNDFKAIQNILFHSQEFKKLTSLVEALQSGKKIAVHSLAGSLLTFALSRIYEERNRQIVVIASDRDKAEKLRDDCAILLGSPSVLFFGERLSHEGTALDLSSPLSQIETLQALAKGADGVIIASPHSISQKVPKPEKFVKTTIELKSGAEHNFQELLEQLASLGFEKKDFVESYGDYAVRGGILDIFSYVGENPLRLEFWGNTIESLREFDVLSQRSIKKLEKASIVPTLSHGTTVGGEPSASEYSASLIDYLKDDALIVFDEPAFIEKEFEELHKEGIQDIFSFEDILQCTGLFPVLEITAFAGGQSDVNFNSISQPSFNGSVNLLVDAMKKLAKEDYKIFLTCDTKNEAERLNELIEDVLTSPESKFKSEEREEQIQDTRFKMQESGLEIWDMGYEEPEENIHDSRFRTQDSNIESDAESGYLNPESSIVNYPVGRIGSSIGDYKLLPETLHSGFIFRPAKIALFTEHEIFGRLRRRGTSKRKRFKGFSQKEIQQLRPGDFVVHVDRGIGMFSSMQKITVGGVEQEVMKLQFDEGGILYVNLQLLTKVQKYSSKEGYVPKLNKLGSGDWERVTARAKKRIKDIARDLIKLYAKRKLEQGFAFNPDTHWQKELEASFMYEDTPDQARATLDVKQDMESASPMDRLVCGDVGFGKTEVAVRAAFKAVTNGKQVAILVPTTILAMQHHNTFMDRLSKYAVTVEHLTRFKTAKEQKLIVEGLKSGSVDIVIGTHRLLSKDIGFKDLGLLIIDEEHRFGVAAKEKLRQFRAAVDTLALTATPIPRTLQFSLLGARDLSLIATPPRNRLPIQTELIQGGTEGKQAHWHVVREAIIHELHRGGQVYFVHDRVDNIDAIAGTIRSKIPEAKVHSAHGQMEGHELEQTMMDFLEKKYDVLVCTKIIESGLDIPSVNTIIVNRADRFGMAELHQLRGRVGRSNTQAFAYLLTPPLSSLPKPTLRRLQAIEEFAELGSGFNLSMRDLEIRGAGNMLGAEQSGFVADMGFEMYEQILKEAVEELKTEEFKELFKDSKGSSQLTPTQALQTLVEMDADAYIPDFYIHSSTERLDIYRRLSKTKTEAELQEMREELRDRFGEYPDVVENLFWGIMFRILGTSLHFKKIDVKGARLTITLPPQTDAEFYGTGNAENAPFQKMISLIGKKPKGTMKLEQDEKDLMIIVRLTNSPDAQERLLEAKRVIEMFDSVQGR